MALRTDDSGPDAAISVPRTATRGGEREEAMLNRMWSVTSALMLAGLIAWMWAYPKLIAGYEVHPVFGWSEVLSGLGFMDPYVRWVAGAVAVAALVLLLIGRTRLIGAYLAAGLSAFYVVLHATPWLGPAIPAHDVLVNGLQMGLSAEQIRAAGRLDYVHIIMSLVNGMLAGVIIASELGRRRAAEEPRRVAAFALN
jgi:hypothetical protein